MRRLLAAAAALLCAFPAQAAAGPVRLQPLASDEVLLEVDGFAIVGTPASLAMFRTTVHGSGATNAEARRSVAAEIERVSAIARQAGAAPADIRVLQTDIVEARMRAFDVEESESSERPHDYHLSAAVEIRLRNAAGAADVHRRIENDPSHLWTRPLYTLDDDSGPRGEARRRALAAARADAEALAAALGMRIVRTLRVTERSGIDSIGLIISERWAAERLWPRFDPATALRTEAVVDTVAIVGVDYALAPR